MINFIEDLSHNFFGGPITARNKAQAKEVEVASEADPEKKVLKSSPSQNKEQWVVEEAEKKADEV